MRKHFNNRHNSYLKVLNVIKNQENLVYNHEKFLKTKIVKVNY